LALDNGFSVIGADEQKCPISRNIFSTNSGYVKTTGTLVALGIAEEARNV